MTTTTKLTIVLRQNEAMPSIELLTSLCEAVSKNLWWYQTLSNPRVNEKTSAIDFDFVHSEMWDNSNLAWGMVSGYLLANGFFGA